MTRFFHIEDEGDVGLITRKCKKCGKRFSFRSWFTWPLPDDLGIHIDEKKPSEYPAWMIRSFPPISFTVAEMLPHWSRRTKMIIVACFLFVFVALIAKCKGAF
jgi:hypothetical protein